MVTALFSNDCCKLQILHKAVHSGAWSTNMSILDSTYCIFTLRCSTVDQCYLSFHLLPYSHFGDKNVSKDSTGIYFFVFCWTYRHRLDLVLFLGDDQDVWFESWMWSAFDLVLVLPRKVIYRFIMFEFHYINIGRRINLLLYGVINLFSLVVDQHLHFNSI